jgi:hypothetical protein
MLTQEQAVERCRVNAGRCARSEPRRRWEKLRHPRPEGLKTIGKDGVPNLYPGECVSCRQPVPSFQGEVVVAGRRTAVVCAACRMGGVFAVAVRRGVEA